MPASTLLTAILDTAAGIGCFERIQKFLVAAAWEDPRIDTKKPAPSSEPMPPSQADTSIDLKQLHSAPRISPRPNQPAIVVRGLNAMPSPTAELAITDIDLQIQASRTTILISPLRSGKSTLMRAILGELAFDSGDISVSSANMAYCSQTPWILNTTIQQNICGLRTDSTIDEEWYHSVLHACALDPDLLSLSGGDQTVPGSRGITLSGSQRQRIALARAVYAKPEIVLLDDVLSALDSNTATLIFERLLGPNGIFQKLKTTVVLISYSTRHFHIADHIVILSKDDKIARQGSFEELREQEGYVKNLVLGTEESNAEMRSTVKVAQGKKLPIKGVTANDVSDRSNS